MKEYDKQEVRKIVKEELLCCVMEGLRQLNFLRIKRERIAGNKSIEANWPMASEVCACWISGLIRIVLAIGVAVFLCTIGCSIKECTFESLKNDMEEVRNGVPNLLDDIELVRCKVDRLHEKIGDVDALYVLLVAISNNMAQLEVSNKMAFADISNEAREVSALANSNRIALTAISNEVLRINCELNWSGGICNCCACSRSCCVLMSCFCSCRLLGGRDSDEPRN